MAKENCTFHSFKPSGKWYATGRGHLSETVFKLFEHRLQRLQICADNGGKYPGLSGEGLGFVYVVLPDDECPYGYPLMLHPAL